MIPRSPAERQRLAVGLIRLHADERHLTLGSPSNYLSIKTEEKYSAATSFTVTEDGELSNIDYILSSIKITISELSPANKLINQKVVVYTFAGSDLLKNNTIDTLIQAIMQLDRNINAARLEEERVANLIADFTKVFRQSFCLILKSFGYASSDESIYNSVKVFCGLNDTPKDMEDAYKIFVKFIADKSAEQISNDIVSDDILKIFIDDKSALESIISRCVIYAHSVAAVASGRRPDFLFPIKTHFNKQRSKAEHD